MLGLDRGGACRGVVLQIAELKELALLWRREMACGFYIPRWIQVRTQEGLLDAITFTAHRGHPLYAGRLTMQQTAQSLVR